MSDEGLGIYWGLFLNSCTPLEMSLNYCSHNCAYCFANLNDLNRKANVTQIMNLLANYQNRDSLCAKLLDLGYAVCCSNHVDFFAKSNYRIALPILRTMAEIGMPVQIQTKGGTGFEEAVEFLPPSVFYFTISTLDEEISKQAEIGAPPPQERLKQMSYAKEKGHRVVVGINPCIPDWLPDPEPLIKEFAARGVEGVWLQALHLSDRQIKNMKSRERAALGEEVILRGRRRIKDPQVADLLVECQDLVSKYGMEFHYSGMKERSDFFKPYRETYPKTYPVLQDFVNHCYDTKEADEEIYIDEFIDFFEPKLPRGVWGLKQHLGAALPRHFWKGENSNIPTSMNYRQLLEICWKNGDVTYNPVHRHCFAWAARFDDSDGKPGWIQWVDEDQNPILIFNPKGYKEVFTEWTP